MTKSGSAIDIGMSSYPFNFNMTFISETVAAVKLGLFGNVAEQFVVVVQ
jgi:hypothetical protein